MKFNDKYLREYLIKNGNCFTIKDKFKSKLKNSPCDNVIFTLELNKQNLPVIKDFSISVDKIVLELDNGKKIYPSKDEIITSTGRSYKSMDDLVKFYEDTNIVISSYIEKELKNKNKVINKINMPKPKIN